MPGKDGAVWGEQDESRCGLGAEARGPVGLAQAVGADAVHSVVVVQGEFGEGEAAHSGCHLCVREGVALELTAWATPRRSDVDKSGTMVCKCLGKRSPLERLRSRCRETSKSTDCEKEGTA